MERLELEQPRLVRQHVERLQLVGKLVERELVAWLELERLELERLGLGRRPVARSELGLIFKGRGR